MANSKSPTPFDAAKVTVSARLGVAAGSHAASSNAQSAIYRRVRGLMGDGVPPISLGSFFNDIDVVGDMLRPREKRDAILGHVASWGDRKTPMASIQRSQSVLSIVVHRAVELLRWTTI